MIVASIPVYPSIGTLVVELVIFLVAVWLMERWVFDPIRHAWVERDRKIQEGLAASTDSREIAERSREEMRRILGEARREVQARIDTATAQGGKLRDQLVSQATAEFRRLLDEAREQIKQEGEATSDMLHRRIVDMALLAAGRVSDQSYDAPQVRELAAAVVDREWRRYA